MDLQHRFVGSLSDFGRTDDDIRLRREDLLLRLLVCETVILKTTRLLELRCLVEMLGAEGVLSLFKAGRLQLTCEAFAPAFQSPPDATDEKEFQFLCVWEGDRPKYLQDCFADVLKHGSSDVAALASEVPQYILEAPAQAESDRILAHLRGILLNGHPSLRTSMAAAFYRETGRAIDPTALSVEIQPRKTGGYRVSTNLFEVPGFSKLQLHTAVGRGVSSFAASHARFEEMQRHHAIPGLPSETAATLAEHLEFLESQISPDRQAARLRRVVEVADIPIAQGALTVDAQKLIDVTGSPECVQFRSWLRTTDSLTEIELRDQVSSLTSRLGLFVRSPTGKALRFLVNLGVGAQSPMAGFALSVVDTFVLESVLPVHGPIWFVDRVAKLVGTPEAGPT